MFSVSRFVVTWNVVVYVTAFLFILYVFSGGIFSILISG